MEKTEDSLSLIEAAEQFGIDGVLNWLRSWSSDSGDAFFIRELRNKADQIEKGA